MFWSSLWNAIEFVIGACVVTACLLQSVACTSPPARGAANGGYAAAGLALVTRAHDWLLRLPPPDELARSRPLPLLNPGNGTLTPDVLRILFRVDRATPPSDWNDALRSARLRRLTADELASVEAETPSQSDPRMGVVSVAPDASTRVARIEVGQDSRGRSLTGRADVLIRHDTRAVRLLFAGQPVYELERPRSAPRVEAISVGDPALYYAVRVRGSAAAVEPLCQKKTRLRVRMTLASLAA